MEPLRSRAGRAYTARMTARRAYDALVLDLDGTLLDEGSCIRPRNREALLAAEAAGVKVMILTSTMIRYTPGMGNNAPRTPRSRVMAC